MKHKRVVRLRQTMAFQVLPRWQVQARFALRSAAREIELPEDTWLLELGWLATGWAGEQVLGYRTAAGQLLARAAPLPEESLYEVRDRQAIQAMQAARDLETLLQEELGLSLTRMAAHLPPFALIACPLCGGDSFTTLELASVWCQRCNAQFQVRATAGDPGFVVDVTWEHYHPAAARYVLPRTPSLRATLVLKDSADPRDRDTSQCMDCQPGHLCQTDGRSGLRAGLHACKVGTLYDWQRIYGQVPRPEDLNESTPWQVAGTDWPGVATVRVLPIRAAEQQALAAAASALQGEQPGLAAALATLQQARQRAPAVFAAYLPDPQALQPGERYLLHHWLLHTERPDALEEALPVWYVVQPEMQAGQLRGWRVVRADICPCCARPVARAGTDGQSDPGRAHRACRVVWERTGWQPTSEDRAA